MNRDYDPPVDDSEEFDYSPGPRLWEELVVVEDSPGGDEEKGNKKGTGKMENNQSINQQDASRAPVSQESGRNISQSRPAVIPRISFNHWEIRTIIQALEELGEVGPSRDKEQGDLTNDEFTVLKKAREIYALMEARHKRNVETSKKEK